MAISKTQVLLLPAPKKLSIQNLIWWLPSLVLTFFLLIVSIQSFQVSTPIQQSLRLVQRWPQLPSSHFFLAQALFANGQEEMAKKELALGEKQLGLYQSFSLSLPFLSIWEKSRHFVNQKDHIQAQLEEVNQQLKTRPYAWQLLLKKAVLAHQIYEDEISLEAVNLAYWLDPENPTIQSVKTSLETKN